MEQTNQKTALLVMDMQAGILSNYGQATNLVNNVAKAIAHARSNQIPVIYVVVGFREGGPEISTQNKIFTAFAQRFANIKPEDFMRIEETLAPQKGEVIVTKRRISAFTGSDLEVVLRAQGMQHLVLTGIATSGVVLSTLREAADKDFRLSVIADCCTDMDEEVHRVLTTKVFVRQADVVNVEEWCK